MASNIRNAAGLRVLGWLLVLLGCCAGGRPAMATTWPTITAPNGTVIWSDTVEAEGTTAPFAGPYQKGGAEIELQGQSGGQGAPSPKFAFKLPDSSYWHSFSYTVNVYITPVVDDRDPELLFQTAPLLTGYTMALNPTTTQGQGADQYVRLFVPSSDQFPVHVTSNVASFWAPGLAAHQRIIGPYDRAYNGKYLFECVTPTVNGQVYAAARYFWLNDGVWMDSNPGPKKKVPPAGSAAPASASASGKGEIELTVYSQGVVRSGVVSTIAPTTAGLNSGTSLSLTSNSSGKVLWHDLDPGVWDVAVNPSVIGGSYVSFPITHRTVRVTGAQRVNLALYVNATTGEVTWYGGSDPSAQGADNGGSSSSNDTQPSWIQSWMSGLFTPSQSKLDQFKTAWSALWNWGPFGLIGEFNAAFSAPAGVASLPAIPLPSQLMPAAHYGTPSSVQMTIPDVQGTGYWGVVRGLLGAAVYLSFGLGIVKKLMPKPTIAG